jgi:phosphoglucosamine mutase
MRLLAGGLQAAGVECVSAGVIPTPGVAHLVRTQGYAAGLMVSASHNPYRDNGIKVIGATGQKLADETEAEIEERIQELLKEKIAPQEAEPPVEKSLAGDYEVHLREAVGKLDLRGKHLVVDCANGAASSVGPELFESLGAQVTAISHEPDGRNINENCGALHPEVVAAKVQELGADAGIAFDGDADRAMLATASAKVFDGDCILLAAARWMKQQGTLKGNCAVGTVMANLGLEVALRAVGIELVRTKVGDRYVIEEMQRRGANLGGEQSGHVIFLDHAPAGDGLLTALEMLSIVRGAGKSLDELVADFKVFPQRTENVPVREKLPLEEVTEVQAAIDEASRALDERGRVVVRYSGTERLLRVMVEAEEEAQVVRWVGHIVSAVERELGVAV